MAEIAYIALGSNLGDRAAHLAEARSKLAALPGSRLLAESEIEETEPITHDDQEQGSYLNQMVALETTLSPESLLKELQEIENDAGRTREKKWGPRTLDLDIVLFGNAQINSSRLTLPHPELSNRGFWRRELEQVRITK